MKFKVYMTFFALLFVAILTMSNAPGRAKDKGQGGTLAPGDGQFCGNCHGGGNFGASINMKLLEKGTTNEVSNYVPGTTYDVKITISTSNAPAAFGFQAVVLKNSDNSGINTWANTATANTHFSIVNSTGRKYFEQSAILATNEFQAEWTAPAANSGDVTFYLAGLAANASGSDNGDQAVSNSATFTENTVSTADVKNLGISLTIFPNPTIENLTLMLHSNTTKDLTINIYNQNGQNVLSKNVTAQNGANRFNFEVANYTTGVYFVEITDGQFRTAKRFLVRH